MGLEMGGNCSMVPLFQVISNIVHKGIDRINLVSKYDLWDGYYRLLFFFPFLFFFSFVPNKSDIFMGEQ